MLPPNCNNGGGIRSISAGTTFETGPGLSFSNANNISFGISGSTITASIQTAGGTATGVGLAAGTQTATTGVIVLSNSNNVSFGMSNSSVITASFSQAPTPNAISAGTTLASSGTVVFSNSNNISFGLDGNTVTASASFSETPFALAAGTQTGTSGTIVFSNSNGISFGMSGSTRVTASYTQSTAPSAISAGTTFATSGTIVFSNANNISFGLNNQTVTASFSSSQSVQPGITGLGVSTGGNTAGNTGTTQGTVVFAGAGIVTLSQDTAAGSLATITISAIQSVAPGALAAGTQTATSGTIVFANSNNISFGMSGSSQITASFSATQSTAPGAIAAGTQTATSGTIVFSNSNGLTFGMSGSTRVTASGDYVRSISAGTTNATGNQIIFSNSNGVGFGANGRTITASYTQSTAPSGIAAGTQTGTSGTIVFANSNNITFGMSGSSQVTASFSTSQSVQPGVTAIGVSNVGNTLGATGTFQNTIVFAGIGNITLSQGSFGSVATITISGSQSTGPGGLAAGTQTGTSGTIVFSNSNGISFGMSGSTRITASYTQSTAPAAIAAGTQTGSSGTIVFSNSNGISFGMSGSSQITASVTTPSVKVLSQGINFANSNTVSAGILSLQKMSVPAFISGTQAVLVLDLNDTLSSGSFTISVAIYTFTGSTASLASSGSRVITYAPTNYSNVSDIRYRTVPLNANLTAGDYLFATLINEDPRTTIDPVTTNFAEIDVYGNNPLIGSFANEDGFLTQWNDGAFSVSFTTAMPVSIAQTDANYDRAVPVLIPGWIIYASST